MSVYLTLIVNSTVTVDQLRQLTTGECVKNHAPQTGGSWVDVCGEFVAAGEEGTPEVLSCVACGSHRSFHKKRILVTDQTHVSQNASTQIQKEKEYHVVTNDVSWRRLQNRLVFSFKK